MTAPGRAPLSVVVLTFNEERNLGPCLASVAGWTEQVVVVDSGSTDATLAIAQRFGATVASHPFETHARQWAWALGTVPLTGEWVLGLDADQRVTPELRDQLLRVLTAPASTSGPRGYFIARRQIFRGRWIRHGGYYPKHLLKLFRRGAATLHEQDLVDHHFYVDGPLAVLKGDLIEDNQNEASIEAWTAKHNRYAVLQARQELTAASNGSASRARLFGSPDERTRRMKSVWTRLPLFVRPCLYVFYRYVIRLGFLDGKEGFIFHVLQAFWYRLLVDVNLDEMRLAKTP